MSREGQERVEVRPGVWLWLNEGDRKVFAERQDQDRAQPEPQPPSTPDVETTAVGPAETATLPRPKPARGTARRR